MLLKTASPLKKSPWLALLLLTQIVQEVGPDNIQAKNADQEACLVIMSTVDVNCAVHKPLFLSEKYIVMSGMYKSWNELLLIAIKSKM